MEYMVQEIGNKHSTVQIILEWHLTQLRENPSIHLSHT